MASRSITRKSWSAYSRRLAAQRNKAKREMAEWMDGYEPGTDFNRVYRQAVRTSMRNGAAAAAIACEMYEQVAEGFGRDVPRAIASTAIETGHLQAAITAGSQMLAKGDAEGFANAVARAVGDEVKRCASDTIRKNAARDHAEFAWIPGGAETCAFCITVASNGWVRASKAVAEGNHADHLHDNCMCEFAVRFGEDGNVAGYDPSKYDRMYRDADGGTSKDKINSIRRDLYAQNKDAINAQRRERYAAQHQD